MKYKVTLNGRTYEVEMEQGQGQADGTSTRPMPGLPPRLRAACCRGSQPPLRPGHLLRPPPSRRRASL